MYGRVVSLFETIECSYARKKIRCAYQVSVLEETKGELLRNDVTLSVDWE